MSHLAEWQATDCPQCLFVDDDSSSIANGDDVGSGWIKGVDAFDTLLDAEGLMR